MDDSVEKIVGILETLVVAKIGEVEGLKKGKVDDPDGVIVGLKEHGTAVGESMKISSGEVIIDPIQYTQTKPVLPNAWDPIIKMYIIKYLLQYMHVYSPIDIIVDGIVTDLIADE